MVDVPLMSTSTLTGSIATQAVLLLTFSVLPFISFELRLNLICMHVIVAEYKTSMEKEYERLQEENEPLEADIQQDIADMRTKMDAMEAKMDAANTRVEAMFKELLSRGTLNSLAPTVVEAGVNPKVTSAPPGVSNLQRPPLATHGAACLSNHSSNDDARRAAAHEDVGRGGRLEKDVQAGQEEANRGGADEGPRDGGKEVETENVEKEDNLSLDMDTTLPAVGTKDTLEEEQPQ